MIPVGYQYKKVKRGADPVWQPDNVKAVYSVSGCISGAFTDYIHYWKHNDFWFFDTPVVMEEIAVSESLNLSEMTLFYYEIHKDEYNDETHRWEPIQFERVVAKPPNVIPPKEKQLEGFDVVSYSQRTDLECSPLSCNALCKEIPVNQYCLFDSFEEAENAVTRGAFTYPNCEPGPYRIFAVYTVLRFE